jgi:hypothetical protein
MPNESAARWATLLGLLESSLLEADRLDLEIIAARLAEIVEQIRGCAFLD